MEVRRALLHAQRRKLETLGVLRSPYRVMRDAKQASWKSEWPEFWTKQWRTDPGSVWRHLKIFMGRGSGAACTASIERIVRHFEEVGCPPEDPNFCLNCLGRAQDVLQGLSASRPAPTPQVVSVDEAEGAYRSLRKVTKGLDGLDQDVIGPALGVLLLFLARLFSHLLTYAVAPRDWSLAVIALIKKIGSSRSDLDNYRAVHLLCFVHKS